MNYSVKTLSEEEYLKTISGMIRFVCNNKGGIFNLDDSSSFLAVTNDLIESTLDLFCDSGLIKISERDEIFYKIESYDASASCDFGGIDSYSEFNSLYNGIYEFKNSCQNIDVNTLISC